MFLNFPGGGGLEMNTRLQYTVHQIGLHTVENEEATKRNYYKTGTIFLFLFKS